LQNLEVKKINDEKKAAMAAQFAAEATLRRVHAAQKDDDMPPIEAILAPLEAELKLSRQEVIFCTPILFCLSRRTCDTASVISMLKSNHLFDQQHLGYVVQKVCH
jgi:hypothetical protein